MANGQVASHIVEQRLIRSTRLPKHTLKIATTHGELLRDFIEYRDSTLELLRHDARDLSCARIAPGDNLQRRLRVLLEHAQQCGVGRG